MPSTTLLGPGLLALAVALAALLAQGQTRVDEEFDLSLSMSMVNFAAATYCSDDGLLDWTCVPCALNPGFEISHIVWHAPTKTRGYIGYYPIADQIIVSFEGSENVANWVTDLTMRKVVYPGGPDGAYVHKGFYTAYTDIHDIVVADVLDLVDAHPTASIVTTGHSLGAALTALAALDLTLDFNFTVTHYSFGQPRIGNTVFAEFFAASVATSYRIVHYRDVVPHVPPLALGFHHPPAEVWQFQEVYNGTQSIRLCDPSGEDATCSDSVDPVLYSVSDHLLYLGVPLGVHGC